jgi:hypothetical protein
MFFDLVNLFCRILPKSAPYLSFFCYHGPLLDWGSYHCGRQLGVQHFVCKKFSPLSLAFLYLHGKSWIAIQNFAICGSCIFDTLVKKTWNLDFFEIDKRWFLKPFKAFKVVVACPNHNSGKENQQHIFFSRHDIN